jgi:hypothetical protein
VPGAAELPPAHQAVVTKGGPMSTRQSWGTAARAVGPAAAALLLVAGLAQPGRGQTKEGEAKLQEAKGLDVDKKALKVEVGDTVKAACSCYVNPDLFGKRVVEVYANATKACDRVMYFGLYVAFFDKDKKLVGCCTFGGEPFSEKLEAKGFSATTKQVELPVALIDQIASYQVRLVSDTKELGKK